jgi:hypothetical protein
LLKTDTQHTRTGNKLFIESLVSKSIENVTKIQPLNYYSLILTSITLLHHIMGVSLSKMKASRTGSGQYVKQGIDLSLFGNKTVIFSLNKINYCPKILKLTSYFIPLSGCLAECAELQN